MEFLATDLMEEMELGVIGTHLLPLDLFVRPKYNFILFLVRNRNCVEGRKNRKKLYFFLYVYPYINLNKYFHGEKALL